MKATHETEWRGNLEDTDQGQRELAKLNSSTDGSPDVAVISASVGGSIRLLGQDWVVRGIIVALILVSIPLLTPILDDDWQVIYGQWIVEPPFLIALLVAIRFHLRSVKEAGERLFWNLLTAAFASWLVALVSGPAAEILLADSGTIKEFAEDAPYILFYAVIAAALEVHPHVRDDPITHRLKILDRIGSFILLFGLLSYFLVVPRISSGNTAAFWASSLALFVALDAYIILRLWHLRGSTTNREWHSIYTWLLIGATIWGVGDFILSLMYEGILTLIDLNWGTPFDLLWPVAFSAVVLSTRSAVAQRGYEAKTASTYKPLGMGPLVIYVLVPLILHVILYRFGVPDPEFRMMREVLVLGLTAILGCLTLAYHRLLRIENRRLTEKETLSRENLAYQAFHDELTGLPNRNLFRDRLQLAMADSRRYQRKCGILFCDLDQLKVVNDSLGHEAGDQALIAISRRLRNSIRMQDTVARLGGDEFAIIIPGMRQALDAVLLAEKLLAAINEPLTVARKKHLLTASIGIAIYPDDGEDGEDLLKHADMAMYQAKLQGRNTYRLFTESMNEAAHERLAIEQGLRKGLMEDQFAVFYQPIFGLKSGQPVAFEALLRWKHPERGYIEPVNFIDVAEQTELIIPIGKWVLEAACNWAAQLKPMQGTAPSVSVNISPRQLRDPDLIPEIGRILKRTGLAPSRLQLEISEEMALSMDSIAEPLGRLRASGVRIAIDDFGTGYAALSLLQDIPIDIVKIDASFVKGIEVGSVSEAIVLAIVNMARALNFYVVAQGIETESELKAIRQSQCSAVQGFYLCDPLPPEELEKTLASRNSPM